MEVEWLGPAVLRKLKLIGLSLGLKPSSETALINSYLGRVDERPLKGSVIVFNLSLPGILSTRYTCRRDNTPLISKEFLFRMEVRNSPGIIEGIHPDSPTMKSEDFIGWPDI